MALDLVGIEQRWADAAPGPWEALDEALDLDDPLFDPAADANVLVQTADTTHEVARVHHLLDAHAIAAAPQDVRTLLAEVRRLREALEPFAAIVKEWAGKPVSGVMVDIGPIQRAAEVLK